MAAQPGDMKSVPTASRLVRDQGSGNEHLLPRDSGFMAPSTEIIEQKV